MSKRYPYTTEQAARSINNYYQRVHGVKDAWEKGARSWNSQDIRYTGQPAIACTFIESPRTPGAWKEIGYGNTDRKVLTEGRAK